MYVSNKYGITVRAALNLPDMEQIKLIGGSSGIDNLIIYLNVIEVPDIVNWVLEGEFLFTTGFPFIGEEKLQKNLIPGLVERGAAGLCFKPRRYIEEIKPDLIRMANEYQFPLLEVPYHLSFSEIIGVIATAISNRQIYELKQRERVHRELTNLVLRGGTLEKVTEQISELINKEVFLINEHFEVITELKENLKDNFSEYKPDIKQKVLDNQSSHTQYKLDDNQHLIIVPIEAAGEDYGHIVMLNNQVEISSLHIITLEQAATVISLIMLKERQVITVMQNYINEFIDDLLFINDDNRLDIHDRAKTYGWKLNGDLAIGLITIKNEASFKNNSEIKLSSIERVKSLFKRNDLNPIIGLKSGKIIFVLNKYQTRLLDIDLFFGKVVDLFKDIYNTSVFLGIGEWYSNYGLLSKSYEEALNAIKIGMSLTTTMQSNIAYFSDLKLYKILYSNDVDFLKEYAFSYLQELIEYDVKYSGELIKTLEGYLLHQGNMRKLSNELFIHYNTVVNRVKKIEELLDSNIKDIEHQLNLYLSLKILKITENS